MNGSRWIAVACCCAVLLAPRAAATQTDTSAFRLHALSLVLDLDYDEQMLHGRATITAQNWGARNAHTIPLLIGRLMKIDSVLAESGQPLPFEQQVQTFPDWTLRQVTAVHVRLPQRVAPGATVRITVKYAGHLVGAAETGMSYVRERLDPAFTVLRAESFAFPEISEPSLAALRAIPRHDFIFDAEITVPDTLVVATGGQIVERRVANRRATYRLRSLAPVPFLNLPVAPYRVFERGGVRAYMLPADSAHGQPLIDVALRALTWFTDRFGDLPHAPSFALMEIPDGYGSQASLTGGIMIAASALRRVDRRNELYHEISHLWNAPDVETPSMRWNEGLASYLEHRIAAELDGSDYVAILKSQARSLCGRAGRNETLRTVPMGRFGERGLTDWSYSVGAQFFHQLEQVIGQRAFDRAYRAAYQRAKHKGLTLSDLQAAFVREDARAQSIFKDWVHTTRWYSTLCN